MHELFNPVFFGEFHGEVDKRLLLLDELFVLDPVVARVDLADQVKPLLLLLLCDSTIGNFIVEGSELALVSLVLGFAFILVSVEVLLLLLLNGLAGHFNRVWLFADI